MTRRRRITRIRPDQPARLGEDRLAVEEPLEIRVGGSPLVVIMRTPGHDVELAAGFLFSQGILHSASDLRSAIHCTNTGPVGLDPTIEVTPGSGENVLSVKLSERSALAAGATSRTSAGDCHPSGKDSIAATRLAGELRQDQTRIPTEVLARAPGLLRARQRIFEATGGTHAAGLFTAAGELLVVREDVGRRNAVDKVVGWALLNRRLPLTGHFLVVSGRASFELVHRAALAQVPVLAACLAPSSLAAELAAEVGLTLIGNAGGTSMNGYTQPERILPPG